MELHTKCPKVIGYLFTLESINLDTQVVNLYYGDNKEILSFGIQSFIFDNIILDRIFPLDAAQIGYRYGLIANTGGSATSSYSTMAQILKSGELNIIGIRRDKKLIIEVRNEQFIFTKSSLELYKNDILMEKFSPSQAFYIGYLASTVTK